MPALEHGSDAAPEANVMDTTSAFNAELIVEKAHEGASNATPKSKFSSTIEAQLIEKKAELLKLTDEIRSNELIVHCFSERAEQKRLEAQKSNSECIEKLGVLMSKQNQHELLVEDIRMQTAYLEEIQNIEAGDGQEYTFEQHLKKEVKELEQMVERLQQTLDDTKLSMSEEIDRLKAEKAVLVAKNDEQINALSAEVTSLTASNHDLKTEKQALSNGSRNYRNYMANINERLREEVVGLELRNASLESWKEKYDVLMIAYHKLEERATFLDDDGNTSWREHPKVKQLLYQRGREVLGEHEKIIELGARVRKVFIEQNQPNDSSFLPRCSNEEISQLLEGTYPKAILDAQLFCSAPSGLLIDTYWFNRACSYSYIYGVDPSTVLRLKSCQNFLRLVTHHARMRVWYPQSSEESDFFKAWSNMGISFDATDLDGVKKWTDDVSNYRELNVIYRKAKQEQARIDEAKARSAKQLVDMRRRLMEVGVAIRSRHLEMMLPVKDQNASVISKGDEAAHYADAELDAVLYDPVILEGLQARNDTVSYGRLYGVNPEVMVSTSGLGTKRSEQWIQMLTWQSRIRQWHFASGDFAQTKFYAATPTNMLGNGEARMKYLREVGDSGHNIMWEKLKTLYLEEEAENKRKYRQAN